MIPQPKVLIVDDQPINIKILQRKLERDGMKVTLATNGRECLRLVQEDPPDLILLDVMMPEMNGIETCRELRKTPGTETIPVMFITAKSSKIDKLEGLETGAVDYISKPIDLDETLARVKTQLRLRRLHQENLELEHRLSQARETALLGSVTQGITHNLNNLLGVVMGHIDLMRLHLGDAEKNGRNLESIERAVERMVQLTSRLGNLSASRRIPVAEMPADVLLEGALDRIGREIPKLLDSATLTIDGDPSIRITSNAETFETIFCALARNAWESYEATAAERPIHLELSFGSDRFDRPCMTVSIRDEGIGITEETRNHIFDPFFTTKRHIGRGMGLTIAKHSAQSLGGEVTVTSEGSGKGTVASFRILTHLECQPESMNGLGT